MKTTLAPPPRPRSQLDALLDFVSPRVGIIQSLSPRMKSDDEPRLPLIYDAVLAHYDFRKGEALERGACGKGFDEETAMLKAIGEAVERYCASHPAIKRMRRATFAQVNGEAVAPPEFVLYSGRQYGSKGFNYFPWREQIELPWTEAIDLHTQKSCWVPSTLVYLNYPGEQPTDALCPPSSNGLAAGPTFTFAVRNALLELIEREAFLVAWMNQLSAPVISDSCLSEPLREVWNTYRFYGTEIRFFALPTDMPASVVLTVALSEPPRPAAIVGLGADTQLQNAMTRALFEVCQVFEPLRRKFEQGLAKPLNTYTDVHTLEQHAGFFLRPDHRNELEFLWKNQQVFASRHVSACADRSIEEEVQSLLRGLESNGCHAYGIDVTTPDVAGYPIRVVRVLATQMQPIHFGYGQERLGGRRLFELPQKLGYSDRTGAESDLNRCPHPLA